MANGFCPALLRHINDVAGENAPGRKLHIAGMTAMTLCCQNSTTSPINDGYENGQNRPLTVKYRRRPLISDVDTVESCDIDAQPGYLEWNLPGLQHRQHSFHISDNLMRQYCEDATRTRTIGAPTTSVMQEVYELILESANAVLGSMNRALVVAQATEFGVNAATNTYGGSIININENGQLYILDNGIVQMLTDLEINQFCGVPCIVGSGIYQNYMNARNMSGQQAGGMNMGSGQLPNFFYDKDTASIWGANSIGVFAPGSVKLITYDQFVGPYAGTKGLSTFTHFNLPINEFGCAEDCLAGLGFDLQLRYNDCAEGGYQRGWQGIISKKFALWTQPDNAYAAGDPLAGTNGTLKYFVSNDTYSGPRYGTYA